MAARFTSLYEEMAAVPGLPIPDVEPVAPARVATGGA